MGADMWVTLLVTALVSVPIAYLTSRMMRNLETPGQRRKRERWEFALEKLRPFDDRHATTAHDRQYLVTTRFDDSDDSTVANSWCSTCGDAEIVVVTDKEVNDDRARRAVVA